MKIETLSRVRAANELNVWLQNQTTLPTVDHDYKYLREKLQKAYKEIRDKFKEESRHGYLTDIHFGLFLYNLLNKIEWMSIREAANDEFWAYLSIKVIPDIVLIRYKALKDKEETGIKALEDRYYKSTARIWLKSLWWFIHIAWQGNNQSTLEILEKTVFTADEMTGIAERPGRNGMYITLYREILKNYATLDTKVLNAYKEFLSKGTSDTLMRAVLRLHTAKSMVIDPCLYEGGVEGYVGDLFKEFTDRIKEQSCNHKTSTHLK